VNNMERLNRKKLVGNVYKNKADKTIVVEVERKVAHPIYKKVIKKRSRFHAHDEANICNVGDVVEIMETRPFSKLKRWRLVNVLEKAE
jgi:small subunit ribosomal protein S17